MSTTSSDDQWKAYHYNPSIVVPIVASVAFASVSAVHGWLMIRTRAWFLIPLILGGLFEVAGYAARALSASQTPNWSLLPYILQSVLTLVAPALFAGSIYMILGRIILMTDGESHSLIRRKWLTKIFVTGDVLSFAVQSGGAGFMSGGSSSMHIGEYIVIGGLLLQILIFGFFVVVAFLFHTRMRKVPTQRVRDFAVPWQRHLYALYASSFLILVRSVFRVIEFSQGNDGYLFRYEVFMWIFDALLMFLVMILFVWIQPGEIRGIIEKCQRGDPESRDGDSSLALREYSNGSPA